MASRGNAINLSAPIKGSVQVRPSRGVGGQPMAQAVQQEQELTAPLSGVAQNILSDLMAIEQVLDGLDTQSTVQILRPDHGDPQGLTQTLLAIVNEVNSLRMSVESVANRIGAL
jgi:hypothetical protein